MSIAEKLEAKLWELRPAASLARLRRDQGRYAEARDLLAPVYGCEALDFILAAWRQSRCARQHPGAPHLVEHGLGIRAYLMRINEHQRAVTGEYCRLDRQTGRR